MPEGKIISQEARCGHIEVLPDMLYPLKSGKTKNPDTLKTRLRPVFPGEK